jgi:hypothetical protein
MRAIRREQQQRLVELWNMDVERSAAQLSPLRLGNPLLFAVAVQNDAAVRFLVGADDGDDDPRCRVSPVQENAVRLSSKVDVPSGCYSAYELATRMYSAALSTRGERRRRATAIVKLVGDARAAMLVRSCLRSCLLPAASSCAVLDCARCCTQQRAAILPPTPPRPLAAAASPARQAGASNGGHIAAPSSPNRDGGADVRDHFGAAAVVPRDAHDAHDGAASRAVGADETLAASLAPVTPAASQRASHVESSVGVGVGVSASPASPAHAVSPSRAAPARKQAHGALFDAESDSDDDVPLGAITVAAPQLRGDRIVVDLTRVLASPSDTPALPRSPSEASVPAAASAVPAPRSPLPIAAPSPTDSGSSLSSLSDLSDVSDGNGDNAARMRVKIGRGATRARTRASAAAVAVPGPRSTLPPPGPLQPPPCLTKQVIKDIVKACMLGSVRRLRTLWKPSMLEYFRSLGPHDYHHPLLHATHHLHAACVRFLVQAGLSPEQYGSVKPRTGDGGGVAMLKNVTPMMVIRMLTVHYNKDDTPKRTMQALTGQPMDARVHKRPSRGGVPADLRPVDGCCPRR